MTLNLKENISYALVISLLWVLAIWFVDPLGNFPLNDDWSFAKPVKAFHDTGKIELNGWPIMTLIGHLLWGILFTKCFGFSFTVLRISTLVLGLVGILGVFQIGKFLKVPAFYAFLISLLVGFNPLYFSLSFTYMTDVPFFAFSALSVLFFLLELERPRPLYYILAILFSLLATSIRQPGVIYAAAFALVIWGKEWKKERLLYAFMPLFILIVAFAFYEFYYRYQIGYHAGLRNSYRDFLGNLIHAPFQVAAAQFLINSKIFVCVGLYLLPITILVVNKLNLLKKHPLVFCIFPLLCIVLFAFPIAQQVALPWDGGGSILINFGVGPGLLYDYESLGIRPFAIAPIYWKLMTIIALISFYILVVYLVENVSYIPIKQQLKATTPFWYIALCLVAYIPLATLLSFFDRYTLPVLLFAIIMVFSFGGQLFSSKVVNACLIVTLVLFAYFSLTATSTYLNWNRARWKAVDDLFNTWQANSKQIDGGFEVNGWYNYDPNFYLDYPNKTKSWWWVHDTEYMITFSELSGYTVLQHYPYWNNLACKEQTLLVSRRNSAR